MAISHGFPPLTYVSSYFFHYLDFSHHLLLFSFHYDNHLHIWIDVSFNCYENDHDLRHNYTLYKNAGFWLVNSHDIFLPIQALHCEFAEFLLHVGVVA
jgi:hypothetical protein